MWGVARGWTLGYKFLGPRSQGVEPGAAQAVKEEPGGLTQGRLQDRGWRIPEVLARPQEVTGADREAGRPGDFRRRCRLLNGSFVRIYVSNMECANIVCVPGQW